ncbi:ubiquinol--cytochrome-c reductase subunit 9 [Saccharomycopsis crataegensis]|uniref:Complex III subunit 9 n=1 Tax=Saccharomycopsis crataegensis TaxID=43959 RepID=A0AAV5QHC1_9ASCO|nr:ubiquinol--cytochrome-c reductase subunit 9 [Saccharomycopsis crataegensis]
MVFYNALRNILYKRNSVFVATVFTGAFVFQASFDVGVTKWYEYHNRGKLWKDIKPRILAGGDGAEDEDEEDDE